MNQRPNRHLSFFSLQTFIRCGIYLLLLSTIVSCKLIEKIFGPKTVETDDGKIEILVLHMNDVYEIAPLPGDDLGGLARVATLKNKYQNSNENMLFVLAGDFLSPSIYNRVKDSIGRNIGGKQMVECLNQAGLDIAIFGNHEFDLDEADLQERINESEFDWVSSNVQHWSESKLMPFQKKKGDTETKFPRTKVVTFEDEDGTKLKVGIMALTLDSKKTDYVAYQDPIETAKKMMEELKKDTVDMVLPLTHLNYDTDVLLAEALDSIPLIAGGHEHHSMLHKIGVTTIAKADANAKTVYLHTISVDKKKDSVAISSELISVNDAIESNQAVQKIVAKWQKIANGYLVKEGFQPDADVVYLREKLDGLESTVRGGQCELGKIITGAMCSVSKNFPDIALTNVGSIRVDDILTGQLTQYDIFRILPFADEIWEVEMMGFLLNRLLKAGEESVNEGAYIQRKCVEYAGESGLFMIQGEAVKDSAIYKVAMNKYMLKGEDYPFLTAETKGILAISKPDSLDRNDLRRDVRKALIDYFPKYIAAKINPDPMYDKLECIMCK